LSQTFGLPAISRKLAFFADPLGNMIELAEVLSSLFADYATNNYSYRNATAGSTSIARRAGK
jgi:hypothetical protein